MTKSSYYTPRNSTSWYEVKMSKSLRLNYMWCVNDSVKIPNPTFSFVIPLHTPADTVLSNVLSYKKKKPKKTPKNTKNCDKHPMALGLGIRVLLQ